jgi:hypothetical protein
MIIVYISSPYTKGDQAVNVRKQLETTDILMDLGYGTITPLYTHFQHMFNPRDYEEWLKLDMELVNRSDVVLRLPGESSGADREVAHAKSLEIPVVYSIEELKMTRWDKRI